MLIQNNRNYCSICERQFTTGSAYSNHIKSKNHLLKILESQSFKETEQIQENYINTNITNSFDIRASDYDDDHNSKIITDGHLIENESYDSNNNLSQVGLSDIEEQHLDILSDESDESDEEPNFSNETINLPQEKITNVFSNNVIKEYAELIIKHNLSQKAADDIRKFFNKWSKIPILNSAKQIQQIIDQTKTRNTDFKKKLVTSLNGVDYFLEYRTIFAAIAELLENDVVADVCKFDYQEKTLCEVSLFYSFNKIYFDE
ncbi:unnamed protein product [Rhizophagus irregularis]|uniref:C2H2-type domain-containing protein n=1 Tax=Rhizophagus irregularis TaxID=588596 RepID=A0A916EHM9_9GLOM|nr:unnamed protein product [Rhizophagus irregularis]